MALQECQDPSEAALQAGVRSPVEGLAMEELHDDALSARYGKGAEQRVRCAPDDAIGALAVPMHGEAADLLQLHGRRVALPECPVVEPADLLAVILQGLEAEDCHEDVLVVGAPLQLGLFELLGYVRVVAASKGRAAQQPVERAQSLQHLLKGHAPLLAAQRALVADAPESSDPAGLGIPLRHCPEVNVISPVVRTERHVATRHGVCGQLPLQLRNVLRGQRGPCMVVH
mmetsp:Transcript_87110/g.259872  ORF Transcript_87110/g.259872 Transcript_87110/m.259872 type:complete len:229 (-) Transcript_87110:223-909(-)